MSNAHADFFRALGHALTTLADDLEADARRVPVPAPATAAEPRLLTLREAARALSVSVATMSRLVSQGAPCELVGTRRRFDLTELRAWSAARGSVPTSPVEPIDAEIERIATRAGLRVVRR